MEELVNLIANDASAAEISDGIKDVLFAKAATKIDAQGSYKSRTEISIIKFYCAQVLQKVVDCAIQVHGAKGVTDDTILSAYYRHERAARIYDGADEVHKSRVARLILKKYSK